jgi:hypothetical protein
MLVHNHDLRISELSLTGGICLPKATGTTARPLEFQRGLLVYGEMPHQFLFVNARNGPELLKEATRF